MARRRGKRRRLAALLVLLGCVSVLGATFGAGYMVGRHGARVGVVTGLVKPSPPSQSAKPADAVKGAEPALPRLTFYQELTAPLTAPPRLTSAPETGSKPGAKASPPRAVEAAADAGGRSDAPSRPATDSGRRFAVQVAAYATRAQAEALRGRLAARGFAAGVSEGQTPGGTRYRVRVGGFDSRDEARAEVDRIAAATRLSAVIVRAADGR